MNKVGLLIFFALLSSSPFAQTTIPKEYKGERESVARGVLDGNSIETEYRNHGEMTHMYMGERPWGSWYYDHISGIGFIVAAGVPGEREKWSHYYGAGVADTLLNPVIISYRDLGKRISPYSGDLWGWKPLPGFHNPDRVDQEADLNRPIPAISNDQTSWPTFWPDKLDQTDAGWSDVWNGYRGKGLANGALESFYVMDDHSDLEYAFGIETDGPHSDKGVYIPSPSDSTIGGIGLQTEVRTFQFIDVIGNDILFTHYRTTNVSEKDVAEVWISQIYDMGLGNTEDTRQEFDKDKNLIIVSDGEVQAGIILLEHSFNEENGIDDDNDGIIDESKFNGPGELIEGKAAIDAYLNEHYNMDRFSQVYIPLGEFPAYKNERWWTGDEDMDWVAFDDVNSNGIQDDDESLLNDVGRDGLGPDDENYPGPDEGEGDGIPTQGEPNFGELDMMEAENHDISLLDFSTRPFYESGRNLMDDSWLFARISESQFSNPGFKIPTVSDEEEPFFLTGVGPFELKRNTSSYFITALIFADSREKLMTKYDQAVAIYESDYGQTGFITPNEVEPISEAPKEISLSQNYPNPFNPSTVINYQLPMNSFVQLKVFDLAGREVAELVNEEQAIGNFSVSFDARNLSSGMYIYRLEVGGQVITKKLTLIK